jgi:hypothetical protein
MSHFRYLNPQKEFDVPLHPKLPPACWVASCGKLSCISVRQYGSKDDMELVQFLTTLSPDVVEELCTSIIGVRAKVPEDAASMLWYPNEKVPSSTVAYLEEVLQEQHKVIPITAVQRDWNWQLLRVFRWTSTTTKRFLRMQEKGATDVQVFPSFLVGD